MNKSPYYLVIKPRKGWRGINFKELWLFRELFYIFSWRDIKVRYKQTVLGIAWAILQPFLMMIVFSIFFGNLLNVPSEGLPYPIFVFSGLLFWNYFSTSLSGAGNSLVANSGMIKKIFFPRLLLPLSSTVTPLIDFGIALAILGGIMVYYNFVPTLIGVVLIPLLILLSFLAASGLGSFLAAINVRYRDIRYIIPFFIQAGLFITPVIYPTTLVGEKFRWLLALNPMTGIIEAARAGILGTSPIDYGLLAISGIISILLFLIGILYFKKTERVFADVA